MQIATAEPLRRWAFRLLFAAVLLLAAFLRMRGLEYGVPYPRHHRPDEEQIVDHALHMVASHDLEPGELNYPDLFKYLGASALFASYQAGRLTGRYVGIRDFRFDMRVARAGRHYVVCRAVSAAIGVGTVLLVALLARELGGLRPGGAPGRRLPGHLVPPRTRLAFRDGGRDHDVLRHPVTLLCRARVGPGG